MSELLATLREALADHYALEHELGRGGMATVFLAQDLKHKRPVAIKVLHPELTAAMGAERFLREIEIAARLQHPHILPLYDSGAAGSLLYYVMPFVEGESLRDRLNREKQLSMEDSLRITSEVAGALAYAHSRGVVHRDIKPENIMLSGGSAVVADFGIARAITAAGADQQLTQTGTVIGTPAYMSPEQSTGDVVDGRSDQYSLACVTYEMLVGGPPFTGPTAQAIMARHSMDMVSPPTIVRGTIPDAVEDGILRALSKVPADRFPTTALYAEALQVPSAVSGPRRRTTRATPAPGLWARIPRGVAIAGAVLILVAGAWAVRSLGRRGGGAATAAGGLDPRRVAVLYFDDQSQDKKLGFLADGITEALIDELTSVQTLHVISRGGVTPFRHATVARDSIARALGAGSLMAGEVETIGDRVRVTVRLVDGASGADIERKSFEQPAGDLLRMREQVAAQAADFLRRRLGEEIRLREQQAGTDNVAAWVLVQQAGKTRKDADSLFDAGASAGAARAFQRADSLLAQAEAADPAWIDPVVQRAALAYRRSRVAEGPLEARPLIDAGTGHAQRALDRSPRSAAALEMRGSLRYWKWLLHLEPDAAAAAALLRDAEQDLRAAVAVDPSLAGAWSALSHLDNVKSDVVQAKLDAQSAYQADAFFSAADGILWRLFTSSYDLEQFVDAEHWCDEGRRRFPANPRFAMCGLWMLTTKAKEPDVAAAWGLVDEVKRLTPPDDWAYQRLDAQIAVAGVLARAHLADSARHLLVASRGNPEIDPARDLLYSSAFVRTMLGDHEEALQLLREFIAANPERRAELAKDYQWWFRDLRRDPRYQQLAGTGP